MNIHLRKMSQADIDFGMKLKTIAGWNQLAVDWMRCIDLEPDGCFVLECDGQSAGTVTTTLYERRLAWIGMVLVLPEYRRKGFGTRLLQQAMDYCRQRGVEVVKLDATPAGKKLYDTLGYRDEYALKRMKGQGSVQTYENVRQMRPVDLWEVVQMDLGYFGVSRQRLLERLYQEYPSSCWVAQPSGVPGITGYLFARAGANAYQIGPWVSQSPQVALELFKAALDRLAGEPIFVDVLQDVNPHSASILERFGFVAQREFVRMYYGQNLFPGKPPDIYAICGVEKG